MKMWMLCDWNIYQMFKYVGIYLNDLAASLGCKSLIGKLIKRVIRQEYVEKDMRFNVL